MSQKTVDLKAWIKLFTLSVVLASVSHVQSARGRGADVPARSARATATLAWPCGPGRASRPRTSGTRAQRYWACPDHHTPNLSCTH